MRIYTGEDCVNGLPSFGFDDSIPSTSCRKVVNTWVPAAIIGGATLGSAVIGAMSKGGEQESSGSTSIPNASPTEQALSNQFGSLFTPNLMTRQEFDEYFKPFIDRLSYAPTDIYGHNISNANDAYALYQQDPSVFTNWVYSEMKHDGIDLGPIPTPTAPAQYDVGQGIEAYQGQIQGAADTYTKGATQIWNDWQDFEKQYDNIYDAIGPAYEQIGNQYQQNLSSVPALNLGLPGGGSIPLAPKVHSNMYSQQAQTQAGLQNAKFGQQMQATAGMGQGIGNRANLLGNYYNVQANSAEANKYPIELAQWLLQSDRNLRARQPQTQTTSYTNPDLASTLLPALAASAPAIASAFNNQQTAQPQTTQYSTASNSGNPYGLPSMWQIFGQQ